MANNTYLWSYLFFALLVVFSVLQQVVVGAEGTEKNKVVVLKNVSERTDLENSQLEKSQSIRRELQEVYSAEVGVRERTGKNDGKRVEEYLAVTNLGKGYAWCASFVSWTFSEVGYQQPKTAWSPALFPKARLISLPQKPTRGDVFAIWFPNLGRIAHAGFVDEWGDSFVITVEGNTNLSGSAEGDGVYRKRRPNRSIYQVANWVDNPKDLR